MKLRTLQMIVVVLLSGMSGTVRGDIYRVIGKGNTIAPLRSTEVSMDAETVVVKPEKVHGGFHVDAIFTMRNTSAEPIAYDVAFPFEDQRLATIARESFRVRLGKDESVTPISPIELKVRDKAVKEPRFPHDFAAALVWKVSWEANETKVIRVTYDMGEPDSYMGLVEGWRLRYIVKTGALWMGPIGRADITINLEGHPMFGQEFARVAALKERPGTGPLYSYPENARLSSLCAVTWHFENWTPDEDIWLGHMFWMGLKTRSQLRVFVRMPSPYVGAKEQYSDALLERLVDEEMAPWREMFPIETKRDRSELKSFVAEWMYREIFARHGDPFFLGKHKEGEASPPGSDGYDQQGNYLSVWQRRFPRPTRGGWYEPKPGRGPNGSVRLSDLTAQERKNVEFLRSYFTP